MESSEFKVQLREELSKEFEGLLEQMAPGVLQAKAARVIVDSEERVRDAPAKQGVWAPVENDIAPQTERLNYSQFRAKGYDAGSRLWLKPKDHFRRSRFAGRSCLCGHADRDEPPDGRAVVQTRAR